MVTAPLVARSGLSSPRHPDLPLVWLLGALCAGLTVVVVTFTFRHAAPDQRLASTVVIGLLVAVPTGVALATLRTRPRDRFGWVLFASGAAFSLTALAQSGDSAAYSLGRISVWLVEPAVIFLMLSFPSGRITGAWDRRLMAGVIALAVVLYDPTAFIDDRFPEPSPWSSCGERCPRNHFALVDLDGLVAAVRDVREVLVVLAVLAVAWSLFRRVRGAGRLLRGALEPVLVIAVCHALAYVVYEWARLQGPVSPSIQLVGRLWILTLPAVALSFAAGLLRRRLHASAVMRQLALSLRAPATATAVRIALARALEDPTLRIVYWAPGDPGRWIDESGWPAEVTAEPPFRRLTELRADGQRVAAIIGDDTLAPDARLVQAAGAYALVVLENTQLIDALRDSVRRLTDAEQRVAAVAAGERRKIERDLHDGAQQQLLALRIRLSLLEEELRTEAPGGARQLGAIGEQLEQTIEHVQVLARGSYPLLLAQQGLAHALRLAAADAAISTTVRTAGLRRYAPEVEAAVYFSCLEALQNAVKHARGATHVAIVLIDDGSLRFEVTDDGPGLPAEVARAGAGLRNISDRVASVGGRLLIDSSEDRGTHVVGTVPSG